MSPTMRVIAEDLRRHRPGPPLFGSHTSFAFLFGGVRIPREVLELLVSVIAVEA
jgi:hypothetical protein